MPKNCLMTADFNPDIIYTIQATGTLTENNIIVTNGAPFLDKFIVINNGWELTISDSNLVLCAVKESQAALYITSAATHTYGTAYTVTSSGGSGTGVVTYAVISGGAGAGTVDASTGALTITAAGTIYLQATKAGDATYKEAKSEVFILTVNKVSVHKPNLSQNEFTYDGTVKTVTLNPVSGAYYIISGGSSADAGDYSALIGLTDKINYHWADGSTDDFELPWSIIMPSFEFTVSVNDIAMGSVIGNLSGTYKQGETISVTAESNPGYKFVRWEANGITLTSPESRAAAFVMPENSVTLTAIFEEDLGGVTVVQSPGNYGTVTGGGPNTVGNTVTLTLSDITLGWEFDSWSFTGIITPSVNNSTTLTFIMPDDDITITLNFKKCSYNVTIVNTGSHGSISGGGSYSAGDPVTLTVTVTDIGWEFDKWISTDITISAGDETKLTLNFTMPSGNVTVTAVYKKAQYSLTADVNDIAMGSISGSATGNYEFGDSISVTATAKIGYKFVQWNVTGVTLNDITNPVAMFNMPANAVTLTAVFAADMRNVTVVSLYGTVTGAGSKQVGSVVTLTLSNIATGWDYNDWTLTNATATVKNNTTLSFIMPANDVNVTVVFTQIEYNLNVSVNNAAFGSISSTTGVIIGTNQKFYYNDNIDITASPAAGYRFVRWDVTGASGDGSTNLTLTFSMPTNTVTVQAVFESDNGTVSVTQSPGTYGTVAGDGIHAVGSTVTLNLSGITPGWEFDSWGIPASVTNVTVNNATTLSFVMPATGVNITLNFKKIGYQLTVTVNDGLMGGVNSSGGTYEVGDLVSIQATAFTGYVFKKWIVTGATGNNSTNPNLTFNMPAGNVAVEAVFEAKGFNVNVISAQGTVSGGGNAIFGSTVTLTVDSINAGWEFDRWDYTGIMPTTENNTTLEFAMPNDNVTVTAVYKKIQYTLTANVNNNTMGEVIDTALPPNIITGGSYTIGEQVVIAARALPGYEFLGWQGIGSLPGLTQNGTQIKFLMPAGNVTVTAMFGVSQLTVTVTSPDGSISGNNGTYTVGDTVTITANPNSGFRFIGWTSADITITGADITNPTLTFTMPGYDVLIIAAYDGISYDVTTIIDPAGGGSASGGGSYKTGETVNLAATPATGYKFSHWASSDIVILNPVNANITFTMPAGNVMVTAFFVLEDYIITVISPNGTVSGNTGSFNYNDSVTLNITAQLGYKIIDISCSDPGVNLSGAVLGGATDSVAFNMPAADITVTVMYELIEYTITIISQNGTVLGASGTFTVGESVSLAAYADAGYAFGNWSSADITIAVNTNSIITFNMPAKDITITALFIKEDYSVTVITPFGYVTGNENTFNIGDTVTLNLTLQGGYTFLGWSSLDVPAVDGSVLLQITFTMPAQNVTITALFDVILYGLTVISDYGTVSGGKAQYALDEQVSLTAAPDIGYVFDHWESSDIIITNPNSVTLTFLMPENNVTVTAVYRLASYILTVDAGLGNVTGNNGSYNGGDTVNLTAIDTPGRTFDHWESDDIIIANPLNSLLTFSMPYHNVTVKAVFIAEGFTVTVTSYYGSITFDNVFTITGSDYISLYEAGELVNIIAFALPGYKFVRYISSEVAFKLPPLEDDTFIMPAKNVYITAVYIESLEVKLNTEYCEGEGEGLYKSGDYVSITVTPKPGYRLIGWESDDIQISTTPVIPNVQQLSMMFTLAVLVTLTPSYTIYFLMPSYSVYITPIFEAVTLEDFELDKESGSGAAGDQIQLNPIFTPGDAVGEIVWKSSDTSVATVDENGLVTIVGAGTAVITATCGSIVRHFIVTGETIAIEDFELDKESGSGAIGDQIQLNPIFTPGDATSEIVWKSSDTSVATVDENGLVTIVGIGTATITATCGSIVRHFIVTGEAVGETPDLLWLWILLGIIALLLLILIIILIARKKRAPLPPDEKQDKKEKPDNSNEKSIGTNERPAHIEDKPINITISNVLNNSGEGNIGGKDSGQGSSLAAAKVSATANSAEETELNRTKPEMAVDKVGPAPVPDDANAQPETKPNPKTKPESKGNSSVAGQPVNAQIHIDPYASSEQIDKIFESMSKHLYGKDKDKE